MKCALSEKCDNYTDKVIGGMKVILSSSWTFVESYLQIVNVHVCTVDINISEQKFKGSVVIKSHHVDHECQILFYNEITD